MIKITPSQIKSSFLRFPFVFNGKKGNVDYDCLMDTLGELVTLFKLWINTIKTDLTTSELIAVTFF